MTKKQIRNVIYQLERKIEFMQIRQNNRRLYSHSNTVRVKKDQVITPLMLQFMDKLVPAQICITAGHGHTQQTDIVQTNEVGNQKMGNNNL